MSLLSLNADQAETSDAVQSLIHSAVFFAYWALATWPASILTPVHLLNGLEKYQKIRILLKLSVSTLLVGSAASGFAIVADFSIRPTFFTELGAFACLILLGIASVWSLQALYCYHSKSGVSCRMKPLRS